MALTVSMEDSTPAIMWVRKNTDCGHMKRRSHSPSENLIASCHGITDIATLSLTMSQLTFGLYAMAMIEIDTSQWPVQSFWEVIEYCSETFGPCKWDDTWYWMNDYRLYMTEECAMLLVLKYS